MCETESQRDKPEGLPSVIFITAKIYSRNVEGVLVRYLSLFGKFQTLFGVHPAAYSMAAGVLSRR
jgi:hypothetical protein